MRRKLCAAPGCEAVAVEGQARCADCLDQLAERRKGQRAAAQQTDHAKAWRRLYADARWIKAARAFLEANPLCVDCAELGAVEPATDVDHVIPHKGDRKLFWRRSNWQALCHRCHSRKTAREVWHQDTGGGSKI